MPGSVDETEEKRARLAMQGEVAREVWENYENETRRRELSHWRGVGKFADDRRWLGIGKKAIATLDAIARLTGQPWHVPGEALSVLEWGPGGGANAHALGHIPSVYWGVDISRSNLAEASRLLEAENIRTFHPVLIADRVDHVRSMVTEPVDVFLSSAVFQHFPSKEYAFAVLEEIRAVCRTGAVGFIQIRYEDGSYRGVQDVSEYRKHFITATSFGVGEFSKACRLHRLTPLFLCNINERVNYITFCLQAAP